MWPRKKNKKRFGLRGKKGKRLNHLKCSIASLKQRVRYGGVFLPEVLIGALHSANMAQMRRRRTPARSLGVKAVRVPIVRLSDLCVS